MKNLTYLLFGIIAGLAPYILFEKSNVCPHQDLIDWIDSNNFIYKDGTKPDDATLIASLKGVSMYNNYVNNILYSEVIKSREICSDSANYFHKIYKNRRNDLLKINHPIIANYRFDLDHSDAILFEIDLILAALIAQFPELDLYDLSQWTNKGFFIYHSNYGASGHLAGNVGVDKYVTSTILQIAQDVTPNTPNEWQIVPDRIYNFGDLKPPKLISNEQIIGFIPSVFNCNK